MRRLRFAAVGFALLALVLRAVVPVGWMPNTDAFRTTLMPCPMMDGMGGMSMPKRPALPRHPAKHQLPASHEGSICPFAMAAQPIRALEPHQVEIAPANFAFFGPAASILTPAWDHIPRAPPPIV